jgi:hypothetical protein
LKFTLYAHPAMENEKYSSEHFLIIKSIMCLAKDLINSRIGVHSSEK